MKKVSILIPLYNSEKYIAQTIESALNQTWENKEVIVVDDGSTDNSLKIAKTYESDILKIYRQTNKGVCAARNYALKKATGEYIQYIDHDDIIDLDKIEKQMNYIISHNLSDADVVYSSYVNFYDDVNNILPYNSSHKDKSYDKPLELFNDMLIARSIILPASYLMHRNIIEQAGGWNEFLLNNEDGEFYARVMTKAASVHYVPKVKVYWRTTPGSLSKQVTADYLNFKYIAWTAIASILLKNNYSEKTKYACSQLLYDYITEFRPNNEKYLKPLEKFMRQNNIEFDTTGKSSMHKFLINTLGWRRTLLLKEKIKQHNHRKKNIL
ncbi:MAG: glycosyltransferase family 2 protein [Paludibacter sp.]|nr:glycosyltransferase family 2 protein [Paludibacter sp.]